MNKSSAAIILLFASAASLPTTVSAQRVDNRALHASAQRFRDSVLEFEKRVVSVCGIARTDERIVDKFEEATKRVVNFSKNPRLLKKMTTEYQKMITLQRKAEEAIFVGYTPNHELQNAWRNVLWCQYLFEQEFTFHREYPLHGNRVKRRDPSSLPPSIR